ncbi:hypothetical protein [Echinicola sp. 20G]|uniref:hypothetical protein n=1 Tax=Echinicola sp. 20G TaxID=2781961 RepID=UPI0019111607|nr:hypothetical protein [Echinicola sp. 20G]
MKKALSLFLISFALINLAVAQITPKIRQYDMWLTSNASNQSMKGYLFEVRPSSILTTESFPEASSVHSRINEHDIEDIRTLEFRKQGKLGKSIIFGAIIGTAVGLAVGKMDDPNCDDANGMCTRTNINVVLGGMALGGGIGALLGSRKIKIPLNGKKENYRLQQLIKYQLADIEN